MSINNRIQGVFSLTSPMHCAAGTDSSITRTAKQPLVSKNGTSMVPYFPANDFRGRLRRKAAELIINSLKHNDEKITIDLISGMTCGAVSASGENDVSIEEVLRARSNIYMGIFGGGTRMMRSGFKVHDMIPFTEETIHAGLVPDYLGVEVPMQSGNSSTGGVQTPLRCWQLVHTHRTYRVDDVFRVFNMTLLQNSLEDPLNEVSEHQKWVLESQSLRKDSKDAAEGTNAEVRKKENLANIMDAEAIAVGTQLHVRIDIEDHMTNAQKGLILLSLVNLINEQALGGMVRHGWGRFDAELSGIFNGENVDNNGNPMPIIAYNEKARVYELTGVAKDYANQAISKIQQLTFDELWAFFKPNKSSEPKPKKEKSVKTAETENLA